MQTQFELLWFRQAWQAVAHEYRSYPVFHDLFESHWTDWDMTRHTETNPLNVSPA